MLSLLAGIIYAQNTVNLKPGSDLSTNLEELTFSDIVGGLLALALLVAAIIFFFMLVIGGVRWILSGGDKAQAEGARSQITAALVGLVIVFAAWAIASLIGIFFNVDIFNFTIPNLNTAP